MLSYVFLYAFSAPSAAVNFGGADLCLNLDGLVVNPPGKVFIMLYIIYLESCLSYLLVCFVHARLVASRFRNLTFLDFLLASSFNCTYIFYLESFLILLNTLFLYKQGWLLTSIFRNLTFLKYFVGQLLIA
jgi:hypothetical protein